MIVAATVKQYSMILGAVPTLLNMYMGNLRILFFVIYLLMKVG
jgi:hypothetical protein